MPDAIADAITDDDLDAGIVAGTRLLGIAAAPAWRPAIRAHLRVALAFANQVGGFALPDEAEPAPVFSA